MRSRPCCWLRLAGNSGLGDGWEIAMRRIRVMRDLGLGSSLIKDMRAWGNTARKANVELIV